ARRGGTAMKIKLTTVYVDDQERALRFYTEVLGFARKADVRQGPYRWLTVASPEEPGGTELQLALNDNPAAKAYQQAMFQQRQREHVPGLGRGDDAVVPDPGGGVVGTPLALVLLDDRALELALLGLAHPLPRRGELRLLHLRQHRGRLLAAHHADPRIGPHEQ